MPLEVALWFDHAPEREQDIKLLLGPLCLLYKVGVGFAHGIVWVAEDLDSGLDPLHVLSYIRNIGLG